MSDDFGELTARERLIRADAFGKGYRSGYKNAVNHVVSRICKGIAHCPDRSGCLDTISMIQIEEESVFK